MKVCAIKDCDDEGTEPIKMRMPMLPYFEGGAGNLYVETTFYVCTHHCDLICQGLNVPESLSIEP